MTETAIKAEIQTALDKLGIPRWRMQAGGYRGRTRGLPKGTPDILAAPHIRMLRGPVFLWIEVKRPKEKPTEEQMRFAEDMTKRGHYFIVAKSADDVTAWLKEHGAL